MISEISDWIFQFDINTYIYFTRRFSEMGEKMEYAVASAAASATIKTVKTVNWIRARKAARLIFSVALAMTVICAFTVVAFATNAPSTSSGGGGEKVAESMITRNQEMGRNHLRRCNCFRRSKCWSWRCESG